MATALVLVAHGSRDPAAPEALAELARQVRAYGPYERVAYGFREFATPTLSEAVASCVADGVDEIIVVPVFLLPGRHTAQDLPADLAALRPWFPGVRLRLAAPLSGHPALARAVLDRAQQAQTRGDIPLSGEMR